MEQYIIDHNLVQKLKEWGFNCPKCSYKYTEKQIRYAISGREDNQNCPKCNYLIT